MTKTRDLIKIFDRSLIGLVFVLFISFVATTIWIQLDPTSSRARARD